MGGRFAIALVLAGCSAPAHEPCVERAVDEITIDGQVVQLPGRCKAWEFGPTREQRMEFDQRAKARGGQ